MNTVFSTVCIIRLKLLKRAMKYKRGVAPNKHKISVTKLKEIRILTIWILTEEDIKMWSEFSWLRMMGSCKHANKKKTLIPEMVENFLTNTESYWKVYG